MALVTLVKYKSYIKESSNANDTFHQDALDAASDAILNYTDRDFGTANVTESRVYQYDGSGILNIDDAAGVHSVTFPNAIVLTTTSWVAKKEGPVRATPFTYLELPRIDWHAQDPASLGVMGFTSNLDVFLPRLPSVTEVAVTVNADWGWVTVPLDVQYATMWTAHSWEQDSPTGGGSGELSSESVAETSRSFFAAQAASEATDEALPARAVSILDQYRRVGL